MEGSCAVLCGNRRVRSGCGQRLRGYKHSYGRDEGRFRLYGIGKHTKHSLNVIVNKVTDDKTKVSIKRKVMVSRSFFVGMSTSEDPSDGSVEEVLIKNIASLLNVEPLEGFEIEKVAWKRGDPFPNRK